MPRRRDIACIADTARILSPADIMIVSATFANAIMMDSDGRTSTRPLIATTTSTKYLYLKDTLLPTFMSVAN